MMTEASKKSFFLIFALALALKLALFAHNLYVSPQSIFEHDTSSYLKPGMTIIQQGMFATEGGEGTLKFEYLRTPGYPLFLGVLHGWLKMPFQGIILVQILLTVLAGLVCCRAACLIDRRLGFLACLIILFDLPVTAYSAMLLTESLFLLLISLFMWIFLGYLKQKRVQDLVLSAVVLAAAAFVRPIGYYLGAVLAPYIFAGVHNDKRKALAHAGCFFVIVYMFLGLWQVRNHHHHRDWAFSYIASATVRSVHAEGLLHSYARNKDQRAEGKSPLQYYVTTTARSLTALMTDPGSLKYFQSRPLTVAGKVLGYPWMIFWLTGLLVGLARIRQQPHLFFIMLVPLYFAAASIVGASLGVSARFRVPMMPFLAVLSAYGWIYLYPWLRRRFGKTPA